MVEIADMFRIHGPAYRQKFGDRMLPSHLRVMQAIEQCRTEALGGHVYACEQCDTTHDRYHSCKNRHCPTCQHDQAQEWLENQQDLLLPVPQFLVTFTLPDALRSLARKHQHVLYHILFRSSAAALQTRALDPRFIGGRIGMIGVLHTWTRDMRYHPHVHDIVPGGGLSTDGQTWLPSRAAFLVPVKPLSILCRAMFRDALKKPELFAHLPPQVWEKDWIVPCEPVGSGLEALPYLAPYIFRVAISNNRILRVEEGQVTFQYKESATGETKLCTLTAEECIRRFLPHVLPDRFIKVRYYGVLSPGNRASLSQVTALLGVEVHNIHTGGKHAGPTQERPALRCPRCGGLLILREPLRPISRWPPCSLMEWPPVLLFHEGTTHGSSATPKHRFLRQRPGALACRKTRGINVFRRGITGVQEHVHGSAPLESLPSGLHTCQHDSLRSSHASHPLLPFLL